MTVDTGFVRRLLGLTRHGAEHIVSRQRPPDPLELELTDWFDPHGVLDLGQHSRADKYLPRLGLVAE